MGQPFMVGEVLFFTFFDARQHRVVLQGVQLVDILTENVETKRRIGRRKLVDATKFDVRVVLLRDVVDDEKQQTGGAVDERDDGHEHPEVADLVGQKSGQRRRHDVCQRHRRVHDGGVLDGEPEGPEVDDQVRVERDQAGRLEHEDNLDPEQVRLLQILPDPLYSLPGLETEVLDQLVAARLFLVRTGRRVI